MRACCVCTSSQNFSKPPCAPVLLPNAVLHPFWVALWPRRGAEASFAGCCRVGIGRQLYPPQMLQSMSPIYSNCADGEPPRKLTQIFVAQISPHTEEELPRTTENFDTKNIGVLVHPWSGGGAHTQVCAPPTHVTAAHVTAVHAILRDVVLTIPNPAILITGILTRGTTGGLSPIGLSPRAPPGEAWRESSVSLVSRRLGIQNGPLSICPGAKAQ